MVSERARAKRGPDKQRGGGPPSGFRAPGQLGRSLGGGQAPRPGKSWSRRKFLLAAVLVLLVPAALLFIPPPGRRSMRVFDPDRAAALEVDMWQAYYRRENVRLFRGLVTLTHEQYRYSWATAFRASFHLARAAARFAVLRD